MIAALSAEVGQSHAGIQMTLGRIEGVEETVDRRMSVLESRTAPLQTIADQMSELTDSFNHLREGVSSQIRLEVEKALDHYVPISELADRQR